MADGYNASPFILPNMWGTPGEAFDKLIQRRDEMAERDYLRRQQEMRRQEQYRLFNIRELDQDTDFSRFRTGEERFDAYTQKELERIRNKALTEYMMLPPEEAKYKIGRDMKDLVDWHGAVTANIANVKEGLNQFKKDYPNIDQLQAHEEAYLNLANDYIEKDAAGNLVRRKPDVVTPKNYVAELLQPENLSKLRVDTSVLQKAIEGIPKTLVGEKEYTSKRGFMHRFDWGGYKTDYSEIEEDERGRPKRFRLRTDRKVGDIKLIPQDLKEYLLTQPAAKIAADRLWQQEKQRIEEKEGAIDPRIEEDLKDAFLYEFADKYLPHDIRISTGETIPKPSTSIYNFFGAGGVAGAIAGNEFERITDNVELPSADYSGDWVVTGGHIPKQTRAILKSGGIEIDESEPLRLIYENGQLKEIRSVDDKELIADRTDMENAQKKWNTEAMKGPQPYFGEREEKKPQIKKATYTYQGYQYTEDEIAEAAGKAGMSIDEYIKKAGIKKN